MVHTTDEIDRGRSGGGESDPEGGGGGDGGTAPARDGATNLQSPDANSMHVADGEDVVAPASPPTSRTGVELIEDEEPVSAIMTAAMWETTKGCRGGMRRPAGVEQIEGGAPELNFDATTDEMLAKKEEENDTVQGPPECDSDLQFTTVRNPRYMSVPVRARQNDGTARINPVFTRARRNEMDESSVGTDDFDNSRDAEEQVGLTNRTESMSTNDIENAYGSEIHVPEAFLVEEGADIIISAFGELVPPWWKQRRIRFLLAAICFVIVAAATALGVTIASTPEPESTTIVVDTPTNAPTASKSPTFEPTGSPSTSIEPSSAPSACSNKVASSMQKLTLKVSQPVNPKMSIDRNNLAVVSGEELTGSAYVEFHTLTEEGWERVNFVVESDVYLNSTSTDDWYVYGDPLEFHCISISGETAIAGFARAKGGNGAVYVYKQNKLGDWDKVGELNSVPENGVSQTGFGTSVSLDGDLACVTDPVHIFGRQKNGQWVAVKDVPADIRHGSISKCKVKGDTIALLGHRALWMYRIDMETGKLTLLQEPMTFEWDPCNPDWDIRQERTPLALSRHHLIAVSAHMGTGVDEYDRPIVDSWEFKSYHRNETTEPYGLTQTFNISAEEWNYCDGHEFQIDHGIFAVAGSESTVVYAEQEYGAWDVALVLEEVFDGIELSENEVISSRDGSLLSFSIEECTAQPHCIPSTRLKKLLFDTDCDSCIQAVDIDGGTAVVLKEEDTSIPLPWVVFEYMEAGGSQIILRGSQIINSENFQGSIIEYEVGVYFISSNNLWPLMPLTVRFQFRPAFFNLVVSGDLAVISVPFGRSGYNEGVISIYTHSRILNEWEMTAQLCSNDNGCNSTSVASSIGTGNKQIGAAADIDTDSNDLIAASTERTLHMLRRSTDGWFEEAVLDLGSDPSLPLGHRSVSVKGDIVAIAHSLDGLSMYSYNTEGKTWIHLQNIDVGENCPGKRDLKLTHNGMLLGCRGYNNSTGAVYYYTPSGRSGAYTLHQTLLPFDREGALFGQLAEKDGTLAVGSPGLSANKVYLFSLRNATWVVADILVAPEESIQFGSRVALADSKLLVSSESNIFAYDIVCSSKTQSSQTERITKGIANIAAQADTIIGGDDDGSQSQTGGATSADESGALTPDEDQDGWGDDEGWGDDDFDDEGALDEEQFPSYSSTCHQVEILVALDMYPYETSWRLVERAWWENPGWGGAVVKKHDAVASGNSSLVKMCLEDGGYELQIFDWDGICCGGYFSITSEGKTIAKKVEFKANAIILEDPNELGSNPIQGWELQYFQIPYESESTPVPTSSVIPTSSTLPSPSPSVSLLPTEECYWVDLSFSPDDQSSGSWLLELQDGVVSHRDDGSSKLYNQHLCLRPGWYNFTLITGFLPFSWYTLTSNGFLLSEEKHYEWVGPDYEPYQAVSTTFQIPALQGPLVSEANRCWNIDLKLSYGESAEYAEWGLKRIISQNSHFFYETIEPEQYYVEEGGSAGSIEKHLCLTKGWYSLSLDNYDGPSFSDFDLTTEDGMLLSGDKRFNNERGFVASRFWVPFGSAPSSMPSTSMAPSSVPSFTLAPSTSLSPTRPCWEVDFRIYYNSQPYGTVWRIDRPNPFAIIAAYTEKRRDSIFHQRHLCLEPGEYQLNITNGDGSYIMMASTGELIAEGEYGDEYFRDISTVVSFWVPFGLVPSTQPSISLSPTSACSDITIRVQINEGSAVGSVWELYKIVPTKDGKDDENISGHYIYDEHESYGRTICLGPGEYRFDMSKCSFAIETEVTFTSSFGAVLAQERRRVDYCKEKITFWVPLGASDEPN